MWMRLRNVGVDFSVYGGASRGVRPSHLNASVGGTIASDHRNRVAVSALEDISLELHEGDRLGLVGGNGAGKTTLLRVMAGVYEPTHGSVITKGRVVPLLGGALGMDPELPGFDNIVLRARVLGLNSKQIKQRMDDIVAFTELEDFLHLPMRTYSAGMRVRVAFGVATAVDADILLLDEGVGAGDEAFRAKAQERLNKFIERAGILVLATHSASLMGQLCDRAIWLDHGQIKTEGAVSDVVQAYRATVPAAHVHPAIARRRRWRRRIAREKAAADAAAGIVQESGIPEPYVHPAIARRRRWRRRIAREKAEAVTTAKPDIVFDF